MLSIPCPECGPRNETEFHYGGQAHIAYPEDPHSLDDRGWAEYLFYRENPKGLFAERWQHAGGCRKWFNALRDTHTYQFAATYRVGEPRPDVSDPHPGAAPSGPSTPTATSTAPTTSSSPSTFSTHTGGTQ